MTNATVLIGLIGNADFEDANGIVSKACSVAGIDLLPQDLESLEGHQCTTIGFEDIASAEKLVKQLFMQCDKRDFGADIGYAFVLVFAAGDPDDSNIALVRIFGELDARTNAQAQVIETQVYVTLEFYRQLSPSQQDQYKPSVVVANSHVHERYGPDTMKCFVISPIGEEGSEKRQRVDNVFNTYIKPACDSTEFMAIRGDRMVGLNIMEDIKHALQTWPMAIAYLGDLREGINENVVFELGQRTAMELPVVLLRDRWSPEEDADDFASQLPFDLRQFRCVGLPPKEEEDLKDAVASGKVAGIIRTIRLHLQREQTSEAGWKSPFPFATFGVQENRCWCLDGSPDLADFYAIPNPIGKDLDDILPRLMERMPKSQREPFLHDQRIILTNISLHFPTALRTNELVPKIPIVFDEHPRYRGRKFLPLLFRYATTGNLVKLRVGYVDVTKAAQRNQDEVYTCDLSGSLNTSMEGPVPSE